jgi:hypothetical protein
MSVHLSPAALERLRRQTWKLKRELGIPYNEALDRAAAKLGHANWSLLARKSTPTKVKRATMSLRQPSSLSRRHYVHVVRVDGDPERYFCARCDLFADAAHFEDAEAHELAGHLDGVLRSLSNWESRPSDERHGLHRPSGATNLLQARAIASRDAHEASRSDFHRWLLLQTHGDDEVGDLAVDARRDAGFPVAAATRRELQVYLSRRGAHVVKALRAAWRRMPRPTRRYLPRHLHQAGPHGGWNRIESRGRMPANPQVLL